MIMRTDFIFSYWVFIWYLFYIFGSTTYNPTFALLCGLLENSIVLSLMIYYKTQKKLLLLFVIMTILLKILPLYTLVLEKKREIIKIGDIAATFILFSIYLVWMIINKKTPVDFTKQTSELIFHNKNTLPGMRILDKLF